ncbi:hypothetical protein SAMN05660443_2106 [Marinospirillum celere]|uniref:Uncharacterized protein n=1 Tax=Marinospirillum celere TaxID=1122252 RepID=A0A1I1HYQ0_9GAMM|nr:hypothetical protein SAMN05660443_2106 [Marinospirillum celere]
MFEALLHWLGCVGWGRLFRDSRQAAAADRGAVLVGFRQVWPLNSVPRLRYRAALIGLKMKAQFSSAVSSGFV